MFYHTQLLLHSQQKKIVGIIFKIIIIKINKFITTIIYD